MNISDTCPLILSDLYFYDFKSCAYSLLKNIGWDLSDINEADKLNRNIQIGLLQRNNPAMTEYLNQSMNNLIDQYISENSLQDNNIILRQKDGIVTTIPIKKLNHSLPLPLRDIISKIIISLDRKKFLYISNNGNSITVKGNKYKTESIGYLEYFKNIEFFSKNSLRQVDTIRKNILTSDNVEWFMIKTKTDNNYIIPLLDKSELTITKDISSMIDINEVDRNFVWENIVWDFAETIVLINGG